MNVRAFFLLLFCPAAAHAQVHWQARVSPAVVVESTSRGGWSAGALNWFAADYRTQRLSLDVMGSAEPYTLADCGYSHVLAADPNCASYSRDIQAAHPLLMQAGATVRMNGFARFSASLVGAPALGPASYMHRASAAYDPIAPYTDHLTNAYHAAYSVFTFDVTGSTFALAASAFDSHDRHADPKAVKPGTPDAGSLLLSYAPSATLKISISGADLPANAHAAHGGSATAGRTQMGFATIETSSDGVAVLGMVGFHAVDPGLRLALVEATFTRSALAFFARAEASDAIEQRLLILEQPDGSHLHVENNSRSLGGQIGAGAVVRRSLKDSFEARIGLRGWLSFIPAGLRDVYDDKSTGTGLAVFVTLAAGSAKDEHHHH